MRRGDGFSYRYRVAYVSLVLGPPTWNWLPQTVWETRPSAETPSDVHWRRFYFQLTCVHSALELSGRCALQIYLFTGKGAWQQSPLSGNHFCLWGWHVHGDGVCFRCWCCKLRPAAVYFYLFSWQIASDCFGSSFVCFEIMCSCKMRTISFRFKCKLPCYRIILFDFIYANDRQHL